MDRATAWESIGLQHQRQVLLEAATDRYLAEMAAYPVIRSACVDRARDAALSVLNSAFQSTVVEDVDRAVAVVTHVLDRTGAGPVAIPSDRDALLRLAQETLTASRTHGYRTHAGSCAMTRMLLASRDQRWPEGEASAAAYGSALAQAATMPGSAALFWAAVVHRLWRRDEAAVQARTRIIWRTAVTTRPGSASCRAH